MHVWQVSMLLIHSVPTPRLGEDALSRRSEVSREQTLWWRRVELGWLGYVGRERLGQVREYRVG